MNAKPGFAILFVCLGNICRSPLAEGVFRGVVAEHGREADFSIDSAGTGNWHAGDPPDPRSVAVARRFGVDISGQRARQVRDGDFQRFDLILGMDRDNVRALQTRAPDSAAGKIHLFLDYAGGGMADVPDPYYGGDDGFTAIYHMIREASEALLARLDRRSFSPPIKGQASSTI
ncbi:low molecular weight protein-tyrosine-phosphatase [Nitratireductor soli]|uniref:low molecular weight protein-tyrosine-phosphatase n=1 Tax=Nitratireductor soli TaxID=1670619 RepID=UPI00065DBDBE|nr:low molecular weight protein-tyrosine-phosphatase [Nitratireductor soli]